LPPSLPHRNGGWVLGTAEFEWRAVHALADGLLYMRKALTVKSQSVLERLGMSPFVPRLIVAATIIVTVSITDFKLNHYQETSNGGPSKAKDNCGSKND
jgi:hypothetical protein